MPQNVGRAPSGIDLSAALCRGVRRSLGTVTGEPDLAAISAAIHDEFFDVDAISSNVDAEEVRLLIFRGETKKHLIGWSSRPPREPLPPPMAELVIRRVVGMTVQDDAGIGWVDVQGITYDEAQRVVRVSSNLPVEVTCDVRALDVNLIEP